MIVPAQPGKAPAAAFGDDPFEAFFRLSLDMMCIVGVDGRLLRVNPAFSSLSGMPEEALLASSFFDLVPPDERAALRQRLDAACNTESACRIEHHFRRQDGALRQFSWQMHPDPARGVLYATGRDLTDAHAAEEQLSELRLAVQQSSQSIVIADLTGRVEYANDASSKSSGYTTEELVGQNQRMLHSGLTPAATYTDMWATLRRGEVWQGEFINRRKTGELYVESVRISPVRQPDGQITHYLAIKEDITDQKRTQDAIRESKTLLQCVIDAIPDWIYVKDRAHRFVLVNEQCARECGLTPAEMVGRADSEIVPSRIRIGQAGRGIDVLHAEDDAVFAGEAIHHAHEEVVFENGDVRFFETYKRPMRDSQGLINGNLCFRRDITDRYNKAREQDLLEKQLHQAQKMELIGHLTGGIAHDFNNILSAVFGYAELMQMSRTVHADDELAGYVQEVLQAGIRAKELVAQLLTFSHRREAASEAIRVTPIVRDVTKLLRSTMPSTISIACELGDDLPEVLISPVQLHQVLMNLGVNARDAIGESGAVRIRAERAILAEPHICASCHQRFFGAHLVISVRDSGLGIPPENLMRIFDPFFTTKEVGRGSGLGLSVLHGIVHSANGHIAVTTEAGHGSEFRIYLPPHASAPTPLVAEGGQESGRQAICGRVMVVDDEASIVRFMTVLLENLGCQVTAMTSANEALRLIRENPRCVDLVFTDQTMPEQSGLELARAILACRPDMPIVLSTGYSNAVDEEKIRQAGVRRLLSKPVPAKVLADIVADYLAVSAGPASSARGATGRA